MAEEKKARHPKAPKPAWMQWWQRQKIPTELKEQFANDNHGLVRRLITMYYCEVPSRNKSLFEAVVRVDRDSYERKRLEFIAKRRGLVLEKPTVKRTSVGKVFAETCGKPWTRGEWRNLSSQEKKDIEKKVQQHNAEVQKARAEYSESIQPPPSIRPGRPPKSSFEHFMLVWPRDAELPAQSAVWAQMTEEQRRPFDDLAKNELELYTQRMMRYQEFILNRHTALPVAQASEQMQS